MVEERIRQRIKKRSLDGATTLVRARKRGRILYRASPGTRYTPFLIILWIVSMALTTFNPVFISFAVLIFIFMLCNAIFLADKGFTVYEKGILIPISRFRNMLYRRQNITYRRFVPFNQIEFFYPCTFKIYKNIIIPNGLTIKTSYFEYNLPHEFARVLSKKLRVALKDEFDRLYKADFCIYRTAGDWNDVDTQLSEYSRVIVRTAGVYLTLFLVILFGATAFAHSSGYPFPALHPILQGIIIIDSAIVSAYILMKIKPGLLRSFYHAVFRTWIAMQKGEGVPDKISSSYNRLMKGRISREADVLEIFALDRKERISRGILLNIVVLVQVMLIFSIIPPDLFFGEEADYSDSYREFPYEPLVIEEDIIYEDIEIFANEIVTGNHSVTIRNSTIWALGGPLMKIGSQGSIHAENSRFLAPFLYQTFISGGSRNSKHTMVRDILVPQGARLEFLTRYSMDYGFDFGYVEISRDGENWSRLEGEHTSAHRKDDAEVGYDDSHAFTGTSDWLHETISLDGYSGQMKLRFHHITDDHRLGNEGSWMISDIRLIRDGESETLPREGWDILGWTVGDVYPNEFWMELEGVGEFVNCSFQSRAPGDREILTLRSTNVIFTDCTLEKNDGPVIQSTDSSILFDRVNLTAPEDMMLDGTEITMKDSEIRSNVLLSHFYNSYLIIENSTFRQGYRQIDPGSLSTHGSSGIMVWREANTVIRAERPDGENASGIALSMESLHGDTVVTGITDQSGIFNTSLISGYEFYGTSTPRTFLEDHILLRSDMYRITLGNRSYYRYIGADGLWTDSSGTDSPGIACSLQLVTGEAPDLAPDLSSFDIRCDDNASMLNVSMDITNHGNLDAENFSVLWNFTTYNITQENLSVPAGQSITLNVTGNRTERVVAYIDVNDTQQEFDESNNIVVFRYYPESDYYSIDHNSRIYAYGDHVTDEIDSDMSIIIYGNLAMIDGTLNFSNPGNRTRSLTVHGGLYLENCTDLTPGSVPFSITSGQNAYISACNLTHCTVYPAGNIHVLGSDIDYLKPDWLSSVHIADSSIDWINAYRDILFLIMTENSIGSVRIEAVNTLLRDNVFEMSDHPTAILLEEGYHHVEDNQISGYDTGISFEGRELIARNNVIKDCELAVAIDQDDSFSLIQDLLEHNTFLDCSRQLMYTHKITIYMNGTTGKSLASELSDLKRAGLLENTAFDVFIENETTTLYSDLQRIHHGTVNPKLVQFIISGDGTYQYPEYRLTISKQFYGYHYSTFSNITDVLDAVVQNKGDAVLRNMGIKPKDDEHILLDVTVTAVGLNVTDLKIGIFLDGEKMTTFTFPHVRSDTLHHHSFTLPIEAGTSNISVRILSNDPYSANNELLKKIRMITRDEVISPAPMDHSIVVARDANVEISDGTLEFLQTRDNHHEIIILEGGKLEFGDTILQSDFLYALKNYGTLEMLDSRLIRPGSEFSATLRDGLYYQNPVQAAEQGSDPFELELHSGIINHGILSLDGCRITRGGLYSEDFLTIRNTTMTGTCYPYGHPEYGGDSFGYPVLFASGHVKIYDSNISNCYRGLYLYNAEFEIRGSEFLYSYSPEENLSLGQNWAYHAYGHLILGSSGSIDKSSFNGSSLDIRNSTVDVQGNSFSTDHPSFNSHFQLIMRNTMGIFMDNDIEFNVTYSWYQEYPVVILKNCSGLTFANNTMIGAGRGIAIESYYSPADITANEITNFSYGFLSYGEEFDHTTNSFTDISKKEYSQWYQLELLPDDGLYHQIEDVDFVLVRQDGSKDKFNNVESDSLYDNEYLLEGYPYNERTRLITWMEGYSISNDEHITNNAYNITVSKGPSNKMASVNITIRMDGNKEKRVVLPLPELGANMKVTPGGLTLYERGELIFTVYNNGSLDAENFHVEILVTDPDGDYLESDTRFIESIGANSSMDISFYWDPTETEFIVKVQIKFHGEEASSRNNSYFVTLTAREQEEEDTSRDTTFRALTLFFVLLALLVFGSVYVRRGVKERTDAQGLNFDVDEFRRSLKAVGTAKADGDSHEIPGTGGEVEEGEGDHLDGKRDHPGGKGDHPGGKDSAASSRPPPPFTARVLVPGKDICPECHKKLPPPDVMGIISCISCGWMKFTKESNPQDTTTPTPPAKERS